MPTDTPAQVAAKAAAAPMSKAVAHGAPRLRIPKTETEAATKGATKRTAQKAPQM